MAKTNLVLIAVLIAIACASALEPNIATDGDRIVITASAITFDHADGGSITSGDLLELRTQMADALKEITRLTTLTNDLTKRLDGVDGKLNTINASQNKMTTDYANMKSDLATTNVVLSETKVATMSANGNLVKFSDFSNTTDWRQPVFDTARVAWDSQTFVTAHEVVERTHEPTVDTCYGAFPQTNLIAVDPLKTYEFGIWLKTTGKDLKNYLGFYIFDENKQQIKGDWNNPYFSYARMAPKDDWTYVTGVLRSSDSPVDTSHKTVGSLSTNYKMPANTSYLVARWGTCYGDGDGEGTTWYVFPEVKELFPDKNTNDDVSEVSNIDVNLIDGADFSNTKSWVTHSDLGLTRTTWNDGSLVTASMFVEHVHDSTVTQCYGTADLPGEQRFVATNYIKIDPSNKYEFGIWIKSNDTSMNNMFGFYLYDKEMVKITGEYSYPYFRAHQYDPNYFVYQNAVMWPADTVGPVKRSHSDTSSVLDYKFHPEAAYMVVRFGACYGDGNGDGASWFMYPSVKQVFRSKLEGFGVMAGANAVSSLGRWNVPVEDGFKRVVGTQGSDPSPWVRLITPDSSSSVGIGFTWGDYNMSVSRDGSQELVYRVCLSYSDNAGADQDGLTFQLRRIKRTDVPTYGSKAPYSAGYVFWQEKFPKTWSAGATLYHHDCGKWLPADSMSCGYSWADTCEMNVQAANGGTLVDVLEIDLEVGVRRRV
eukprot:m.199397 g.199397  ORF g.199397 m.199397 type:complete len:708 (+) comp32732_c1_seq2:28-2151(+)